jgi:hypothetical protein
VHVPGRSVLRRDRRRLRQLAGLRCLPLGYRL